MTLPTIEHNCPYCGESAQVPYAVGVFSQNYYCNKCLCLSSGIQVQVRSAKAIETDLRNDADLANLMSTGMALRRGQSPGELPFSKQSSLSHVRNDGPSSADMDDPEIMSGTFRETGPTGGVLDFNVEKNNEESQHQSHPIFASAHYIPNNSFIYSAVNQQQQPSNGIYPPGLIYEDSRGSRMDIPPSIVSSTDSTNGSSRNWHPLSGNGRLEYSQYANDIHNMTDSSSNNHCGDGHWSGNRWVAINEDRQSPIPVDSWIDDFEMTG